jgi:hypothetical protein
MDNIIFSVIAPAIRKENYKRCYHSFYQNSTIPFEMIFVGNNPPTEFIGKNFKYIYSTVKPAQCVEIAARTAQGDYLIHIVDDIVFSENFLDTIYKEINEIDTNYSILSFALYPPYVEGCQPKIWKTIKTDNYYGVEIPSCACIPTTLWKELGGIDNKFINSYFAIDLYLRCWEKGMIFKFSKSYIREIYPKLSQEEADYYNKNSLFRKYENYSSSLLDFLWLRSNFRVSKKRLCTVDSFDDKDILTVTQGEKGEWL